MSASRHRSSTMASNSLFSKAKQFIVNGTTEPFRHIKRGMARKKNEPQEKMAIESIKACTNDMLKQIDAFLLDCRIKRLPQELQDAVLLETLRASLPTGLIMINVSGGARKAVWQLQVNRQTRRLLLESYYGSDRRYRIICDKPDDFHMATVVRWLLSQTCQQRCHIKELQLPCYYGPMWQLAVRALVKRSNTQYLPAIEGYLQYLETYIMPDFRKEVLRLALPIFIGCRCRGTASLMWVTKNQAQEQGQHASVSVYTRAHPCSMLDRLLNPRSRKTEAKLLCSLFNGTEA